MLAGCGSKGISEEDLAEYVGGIKVVDLLDENSYEQNGDKMVEALENMQYGLGRIILLYLLCPDIVIKFSKDNEIKERIINETNKKFDEVLKIIQRRIGKFNGKK